jgi:hypothetical protein
MLCPICNSHAEEIDKGKFEGTTFRCPRHGEFEVADTVLKTKRTATSQQWENALNLAKERAKPNARPRILTSDF